MGGEWRARAASGWGEANLPGTRHTGYGGYGDLPRGSRVFEARLGSSGDLANVRSWIRLEDHTSQNTNLLVVDGNTTLVNTKDPAPSS